MVELCFYTACARVRIFHFLVNLVLILEKKIISYKRNYFLIIWIMNYYNKYNN